MRICVDFSKTRGRRIFPPLGGRCDAVMMGFASLDVPERRYARILRPLVLETLFRASSLRTRYARGNERKRRIPSCQEALSPLRLSI